jgi:tRNA (guanine37-N1)-methyltransferase
MVLLAEPLQRCLDAIASSHEQTPPVLVHFSPAGRQLDQALVRKLAAGSGATLLCGRYEGVDQRLLDRYPQRLEISLGDFVLSGGELAALVLLDAVARLQPGVLNDPESHRQDSFEGDGLLDCPHYSRPEVWPEGSAEQAAQVPAVLLSGHHERIARWRREQSLALTAKRRPDLLQAARARGALDHDDERFLQALSKSKD